MAFGKVVVTAIQDFYADFARTFRLVRFCASVCPHVTTVTGHTLAKIEKRKK